MKKSTQPFATALFERMSSEATEQPPKPREWIWAVLPDMLNDRLCEWRDMLVKAVPVCEPVKKLHVTLFHELLNFDEDLGAIISTAAKAEPIQAMLGGLKTFKTETGVAIVLEVVSHKLEEFRHQLEGQLEHTPSIHVYSPHITIGYVPNEFASEISQAVEMVQLHGIFGEEFVIESINAGTKESHYPCEIKGQLFGMGGFLQTGFKPTRNDERQVQGGMEKAGGLTTLSGESGGFLLQPRFGPDAEYSIDIDDEDEDEVEEGDDQDEDDTDEQWIKRSMEMADSLDDMFGEY